MTTYPRRSRADRKVARELGQEAALKTKALRQWKRHLDGWLEFLEQLRDDRDPARAQWREKMRGHYGKLADSAIQNFPDGGERDAVKYRTRLNRC